MSKLSSRPAQRLARPQPIVRPQPRIDIRPIEDQDGFAACVELQRRTWGRSFSDVVPASMLQVTAKMGGVVLGAFDSDGELVGFVYGVSGFRYGAPAHWSHMLAVRPEARDLGVGQRLKRRQREMLLEIGVRAMYWTFDPLVSRNAHLNLNRLGVRVAEFVPDMYGSSDSELHDLGTDRFVVEWRLDTEPDEGGSTERLDAEADDMDSTGRPGWSEYAGVADDPRIAAGCEVAMARAPLPQGAVEVSIPADIEAVKARSVEEALGWRASTREAFARLLAEGRRVVAFVPGAQQSKYILSPADRRTAQAKGAAPK